MASRSHHERGPCSAAPEAEDSALLELQETFEDDMLFGGQDEDGMVADAGALQAEDAEDLVRCCAGCSVAGG